MQMFSWFGKQNGSELSTDATAPFENNFVFFDVETPNRRNDRISSIGVIVIQGGVEVLRKNFLVNPECEFDDFNIDLTGINPGMVITAPIFPRVWKKISGYFESSLCVGHNVTFDLSVLDKTLTYYGLADNFGPISYADTLTMVKHSYSFDGYGLKVVCGEFGIDLGTHHNSLDDANSCLEVFYRVLADGYWSDNNIMTRWFGGANMRVDRKALTKSFTELKGILYGLALDDVIAADELDAIRSWMSENQNKKNYKVFQEVFDLLNTVLESETLSVSTYRELLECSDAAIDNSFSENTIAINILKGILRGLVADNKISSKEIGTLREWMLSYSSLGNSYPFNKIFELVEEVSADGAVSSEENLMLIDRFNKFIDPISAESSDEVAESSVDIVGKNCCITGSFTHGSRSEIKNQLAEMGAIIVESVTRKTEVLVVGGSGSSRWAYGNYGGKIKRALEMQDKGIAIQIVREPEIFGD
ncbi:MAG: exonuclease domain-containing protein [Bifidobacteriaceae bacterium]|nr:exonuclease domain-containing protein [Bifidobacteriaceae bacterium]